MPNDDVGSAAPAEPSENVRMLTRAKRVVQTLQQYARERAPEVAHLPLLLAKTGYTNAGHAVLGLVQYAGFAVSADGKKLSWRADPAGPKLQYRETASENSLKPKAARQTAMGSLDDLDLVHDAAAPTAGSRTAQAAAAARPPAPQKLELTLTPAATARHLARASLARCTETRKGGLYSGRLLGPSLGMA